MAQENEEFARDIFSEDDEDTQKDKYLTFHVRDEEYGLPIYHVTEVVGLQNITRVPDTPDFVKGVINLRGQVIPVVDIRLRFHIDPREYDDRTCVIIINLNEVAVGLVVDEVSEVRDISEDKIDPPPRSISGARGRFIEGMGKMEDRVIMLLDVQTLLFADDSGRLIMNA